RALLRRRTLCVFTRAVGAGDFNRHNERHGLRCDAVVVHLALADIPSVRNAFEPAPDHRLSMVEHALDGLRESLETVALDNPEERRSARTDADDLGIDVARDHLGHPRVGGGNAEDILHQLASPNELYPREDRAFLEHVDGVSRVGILSASRS